MTENLELREWIAVNVMGWEKRSTPNGAEYFVREGVDVSHEELPPYELTWNDAALVVGAMKKRGYAWQGNATPGRQRFRFFRDRDVSGITQFARDSVDGRLYQFADSVPTAICLAAKAAIEGEG